MINKKNKGANSKADKSECDGKRPVKLQSQVEQSVNVKIDKEDVDVLLEGEYTMLGEERLRRSNEQTQHLKFVLFGILVQFALITLELLNSDTAFIKNMDSRTLSSLLLMASCGVVIITTIIFFLWLDHAITISAIDNFFKNKEQNFEVQGWYFFRQKYSQQAHFSFFGIRLNLMEVKIQMFKMSIFSSFLLSPLLFILMSSLTVKIEQYNGYLSVVNYSLFGLFTFFILAGLALWQFSGKNLYFGNKIISFKQKNILDSRASESSGNSHL